MQGYENPAPLNVNLATYLNRLYLLDPARNQIWRHPPSESGIEYLPSKLPWLVEPGDPDVTGGIDLAVDGQVYVLQRDGVIVVHNPYVAKRFDLSVADGLSHVPGLDSLPAQPIALFARVRRRAAVCCRPRPATRGSTRPQQRCALAPVCGA